MPLTELFMHASLVGKCYIYIAPQKAIHETDTPHKIERPRKLSSIHKYIITVMTECKRQVLIH